MNKEKIETRLSEHALTILVAMLVVAVGVSVIAGGAYVLNFYGHSVAEGTDAWGQFGDYFGGILNPVFGFLSVMALLVALVLQNRELRLSTQELRNSSEALKGQNRAIEHQSFEQTFFAWLNNYHELLQSISHHDSYTGQEKLGRNALYSWWSPEHLQFKVHDLLARNPAADRGFAEWRRGEISEEENTREGEARKIIQLASREITPWALSLWNETYLKNEYQLDSLFRNLYRLILWIHSQHESQLTKAQKWLYVSIVRGQLSWIEQVYLFYNGLTERGEKFRGLANTYALFDNLTYENDPVLEHVRRNQPTGAAYEERAFDSVLARRAIGLPESAEEVLSAAAVNVALTAYAPTISITAQADSTPRHEGRAP